MESYEETSFDDVQILCYVCNFGTTIVPIKQEPPDDGYEQFTQVDGCSTNLGLENTFTESNQVFHEYYGDTCQNSVVSSTVKLETDSCEVTDMSPNDIFEEMPRSNSPTLLPNSYNAVTESFSNSLTFPSSSTPNRKLKKVPNVTTFQMNSLQSTHSMDLDLFGRQTSQQKSLNQGNANVVKRKRGRPPGQKNKNPRKNSRTSSETLLPCSQGLENYGTNFQKYYPLSFLGSNGVFNAFGSTPCVKTTRKYKKRIPKPRCEIDTTREKPKLPSIANTIFEQHANCASSSNFCCDSSVIPSFPKMPDFQVFSTIQDETSTETREKDMPDEICNSSHANQANDISISNDVDQNIDNTITLPTSTQETAVFSNASEVSSLNPLQSETSNLFRITSSDEDEGPATVYQIKTNRQSNAMYNSNVFEECLIGKSNTDKSLQISEENCNPENNTISSNSNELPSSDDIRSPSISPNFQNVSNLIQEEANSQFPENELELPENFNLNSMPQNVIKVSNGIIYPNNCDWRNFSYLVYTPDNTSFYAFDPKNPNVVSYMNENQSNVLQQDLHEYKLIQLEIRGKDKFGYLKHIQTSNNKRFECDNCTITYEKITTEDAKKVLDMSKYSLDYPYNCGQTIPVNDNYQKELVESHRVCFWNTSLYQGIVHSEDNDGFSQKETSNVFLTVHDVSKETVTLPCCRLLGLSDLSFEEVIDCVKNNEKLKDLIEKEIESYNGKNQSLRTLSNVTNITNTPLDVENNQTSDLNQVKVKLEPFEELPVSKNVPENFFDESLKHTNSILTEDINSEDISFLDSLPSYSNFQLSNSRFPPPVKSENPWTNSPFQQHNIEADNQFYSKEYKQDLYQAATPEKTIIENTRSFSYQNNLLFSSRSFRQYMNNSDMDYFTNRRCSNLYESNAVQENINYERNQQHQIVSNCSTNNSIQNKFPFGNTCPPALPFSSSNQFSASRSYSEFTRTKEFNYSSRFSTNSKGTASFSNDASNCIHYPHNAYNQSQTTYRSASLHCSDPLPNQAIGEPSRYQRVNNIDLKSKDKTISKLPGSSFGRKPQNLEINPAYRFNSGGTIVNLNCNNYQDTPQPSPLNLSNSFSPNQYSYQNPVCSRNQCNSSTNDQQLPIHGSYPMYANEEPANPHASNVAKIKEPYDYQLPSGYNEFRTLPQSVIIETTQNLRNPIYNESTSHNPFVGVTRPSYRSNLDKVTNSNSYRGNSILNQKSLLETKETHHEIPNTNSNCNYIRDPTCEISPLQILQNISTRKPNVLENHTNTVKTKKDISIKNDKTLSKNLAIKHRAAERSFSSTCLVAKDFKKVLEDCYQKEKKPNAETRHKLATKTGQTETQVNTWFKNRRQTEKRKLNESLHGGKQRGKGAKSSKLSPDSAESNLGRCSEPSMPILPPS